MSPSHAESSEAAKRVRNPFLSAVLGNPLEENPTDVPEINAEAFRKCLRLIDDVREQRITLALLLFGEPGAGKTHLLSRLRATLERESLEEGRESVFIPIRMVTSANMLWRFLRRHLAVALLRQRTFARVIRQTRDEIAEQDRNLAVILGNLNEGVHFADSAAWLRGQELPEDVLKTLGVVSASDDEEQEAVSRQFITTVCGLGEPVPFVFCFDQLEALRSYQDDTAGFFKLGQVISDLHDSTRSVALFSCLQTSMLPVLETAVQSADRDRMLGKRAALKALDFEQALQLIAARLRTVPELQGQHPIKKSDIKDLFEQDGLCVARKVIVRCQEVFEKWSQQPPPAVKALPEDLEDKLRKLERTPRSEDAGGILRTGLPAMLHLRGMKLIAAERPNSALDGVVQGKKPTAIAVANQKAGWVLIKRLEGVHKDWQASGAPGLVILRDARNGIGVGAAKTREALQNLEKAGARVVSVKPEALAVLEAISRLLANARSGDLSYRGDSVPATTVEEWLRGSMPRAVDELLDEIGGEREVARDELASMLMDLLAKAKVISVEDAASQLGRSAEEVEACGRRNASLVGFAGGSKRVLFRVIERQPAREARE
jgi:hypothetical protein